MRKNGSKKIILLLLTAVLLLNLCACGENAASNEELIKNDLPIKAYSAVFISGDPLDFIIDSMDLRAKVGMLFNIRPESLDPAITKGTYANSITTGSGSMTYVSDAMRKNYENYPAGGFTLFARNITDPDQLRDYTKDLHSLGRNIMLCVDEEGGIVARLANKSNFGLTKFPNMKVIADGGNVNDAWVLGRTIGSYLVDYGFDADFAPVADVNTNPNNPVIGVRAFGDNPETAARMVAAAVKGFNESGVLCTLKHFPGHGDTGTDSHSGYTETLKNWNEMKSCEMVSFISGIDAGAEMVMAAHIAAPNVTGNDLPATLSECIITEKLRNELGFDGIVFTDAMEMGAITQHYTSAESAVMAVKAGIDIILMPQDYFAAFDGVMAAIESGEISEARIDESVRRILQSRFESKIR